MVVSLTVRSRTVLEYMCTFSYVPTYDSVKIPNAARSRALLQRDKVNYSGALNAAL